MKYIYTLDDVELFDITFPEGRCEIQKRVTLRAIRYMLAIMHNVKMEEFELEHITEEIVEGE